MNALAEIVENTLKVVESRKSDVPYALAVEERLDSVGRPLMLSKAAIGNSIIAEVKFASPSEGFISSDTLEDVVNDYLEGGASALSVLTEEKFFKGSVSFLEEARSLAEIPVLRKDFIVDEFQIDEARAFWADGVLLIASILGDRLEDMIHYASSIGLWCLVETRNEDEISNALDAGAKIIGINNRDLSTMKVDLGTTIKLSKLIPKSKINLLIPKLTRYTI